MAVHPILTWPDPVLRETCTPVTAFDAALRSLADDMLETMYGAPGRGLAAPQIGRTIRLFVMDVTWKEGAPTPFICVNPEVIHASGTLSEVEEQCLSIPGVPMPVQRPDAIRLAWQTADGTRREAALDGAAARCAQHELDHLDGLVIFDRVPPDERAVFEARYPVCRA